MDDVNEPIVTRPEPMVVDSESAAALPATGGAEESEITEPQGTRPDRETRRMPYADDHEFRDVLMQVFE